MTERQIGKPYPVDGESFAHGKATDYEIVFDYDDIFTELVEELTDDPYTEYILLGTSPENIAQFIGDDYALELVSILDNELIDDEFGAEKHFALVENFVTDKAKNDLEIIYEYTEFR